MAKTARPTMPFPILDPEHLIAAQQRNVDAMTSAGQIVVEGAKTLALRQGEMMQSTVEGLMTAGNQWSWSKPTEYQPTDQIARVKSAYETAVGNARELADIAVKSQSEAFGVLARAMMANLDDFKSLAKVA